MESSDKPTHIHRFFPLVKVELLAPAELRIAEIKRKVVIYRRGENYFVRTKQEFDTVFKPIQP